MNRENTHLCPSRKAMEMEVAMEITTISTNHFNLFLLNAKDYICFFPPLVLYVFFRNITCIGYSICDHPFNISLQKVMIPKRFFTYNSFQQSLKSITKKVSLKLFLARFFQLCVTGAVYLYREISYISHLI